MNRFAKIFDALLILLVILIHFSAFPDLSDNCLIESNNTKIGEKLFETKLIITVAENWKIPQFPKISIKKSQNVKNYTFHEKNIEQIDKNKYQIKFQAKIAKSVDNTSKSNLELSLDIPMCSEICTIVTKNITITYDDNFDNFSTDNIGINSIISHQEKSQGFHDIIFIIFFALLGGLILNIMPCVLPVILMKLRSLLSRDNKIAILGTIIGNYVSFSVFTLFLMILKISGEKIGWGMHFQNPDFLALITIILFLLTLYSLEIITYFPNFSTSYFSDSAEKNKLFLEHFISSIVASIIAIPCTAPFLGTAATFAIQGSVGEMIIVFLSVATGFSLPYIFAFFFPISLPHQLNKYSSLIKKITNCGILITLLWIMYLLSNHIGLINILLCSLSLIGAAFLFYKKYNMLACILIVLNLLIAKFPNLINANSDISEISSHKNTSEIWKIYSGKDTEKIFEKIDDCIRKNRIVIFNISADWCLTCKYNKIHVFNNHQILDLIKKQKIVCIEGDLTLKNDFLMKIIHDYKRVGIPFTIIYGPKAKEGILLSEIPTIEEIKRAIDKAADQTEDSV